MVNFVVYSILRMPKPVKLCTTQSEYAKHLRPINLSRDRARQKEAPASEKRDRLPESD